MKHIKTYEDYNNLNEYADLKGSEVWRHIKDITPEKENIPNGFKKDIVGRTFATSRNQIQVDSRSRN